ncbi:MAG: hypothetical protein JO206_13250, partial [Solirubrobacterales bacterium]|nr:hypothetical protein [Solirubrobacterales bacterium]
MGSHKRRLVVWVAAALVSLGVSSAIAAGASARRFSVSLPPVGRSPWPGPGRGAWPARGRGLRPRIGPAMGILAPWDHQEVASAPSIPLVYHGGPVMRGVTLHTIFWAPAGYRFDGSPGAATPGYEQLIQQFLVDVAHDSGTTGNVFSVLNQYPDRAGAGSYGVAYDPATDSIDDPNPYPSGQGCPSPSGIAACVTDLQLRHEIERVIRSGPPGERGLNNLWLVFLPPDVDTCVAIAQCGSDTYAGYHALLDFGRGSAVYVVVPDPLIESTPPPGADPQGNPEAELAIDAAAHETAEALSDPEGTGWMDPNGFEVGDKCENGPQQGTPLGFAADGSPYNQVIDGHQYLLQTMWSNPAAGCVQRSTATSSALSLATVNLRQFSSSVSGNIGTATGGVPVLVGLLRGNELLALAFDSTRAGGGWGPVTLTAVRGGQHALGDDRDALLVVYGPGGPKDDAIATGDGGDPFSELGFTGWYDLDHGAQVSSTPLRGTVVVGPCSQTGVLALTVSGAGTASPTERCDAETDAAPVPTPPLGPGSTVMLSSQDNRADSSLSPSGALVTLTAELGEPGSVPNAGNSQLLFTPSGFPTCTAYLRTQAVGCSGLVPGGRYTLTRRGAHAVRHARANRRGTIYVQLPVAGGDLVTLSNRVRRALTALHVAHLRVDIAGDQTRLQGGRCEPGDYYGPPLSAPPVSAAVGAGIAATGTICPSSGNARGMPATDIEQTDEF